MAENKKSFVLYADLINNIDHLTNEEKGILFNHLLEYVNDMNPVLTDRVVLSAWKFIQSQLKRDLVKFEEVKGKRSEAGKESARLRALKKEQQSSTKSTSVESVQQTSTNPTVSVNDNDNDNDNDNVNDIITIAEKEDLADTIFKQASIKYDSYAKQLFEDAGFIEALSRNQIKETNAEVCKLTIHKYLKLFLSHLNEYKHVHQNKKQFSANFSNWLRIQKIVKVYPSKKQIRYS
jgi:uncharacterized protein YdaU (DUF1376 family)